jgi:hypothetical protein
MLMRWILALIAFTAAILAFGIFSIAAEPANLTPGKFVDITEHCGVHFVHKASEIEIR